MSFSFDTADMNFYSEIYMQQKNITDICCLV